MHPTNSPHPGYIIRGPGFSETLIADLEKAVSLWRSPNFSSGVKISNTHEFDNWMQEKASHWNITAKVSGTFGRPFFSTIGDVDMGHSFMNKALETDALNVSLQTRLISYSTIQEDTRSPGVLFHLKVLLNKNWMQSPRFY
jgi:hypothetical protein